MRRERRGKRWRTRRWLEQPAAGQRAREKRESRSSSCAPACAAAPLGRPEHGEPSDAVCCSPAQGVAHRRQPERYPHKDPWLSFHREKTAAARNPPEHKPRSSTARRTQWCLRRSPWATSARARRFHPRLLLICRSLNVASENWRYPQAPGLPSTLPALTRRPRTPQVWGKLRQIFRDPSAGTCSALPHHLLHSPVHAVPSPGKAAFPRASF